MTLVAKDGGWLEQFRVGDFARPRVVIMCRDKGNAEERKIRMRVAVDALVKAGKCPQGVDALKLMAAATNQREFASYEKAAHDTAALPPEEKPASLTFRQVVELWLSGALYQQHPGTPGLESKETLSVEQTRGLMNVILPIIGHLPVTAITREDCDRVKRSVGQRKRKDGKPVGRARLIRYCRVVRQVLGFCVEPLQLIKLVPVDEKWVPKEPKRDDKRAYQMIYPSADAQFMRCEKVKLLTRLYFGLLWRTGMRPGECARLRWRDIVFSSGRIDILKTKTKKPRKFHPDDDVMAALLAVKPSDACPDDFIFRGVLGNLSHVVDKVMHPAMKTAGLDVTHPELFVNDGLVRHIVAHDGRATYVTLKSGLGATEADIMRVTGHHTSKEIRTYSRQIDEMAELVKRQKITWFEPLDVLLGLRPEPSTGAGGVAHGVARVIEFPGKSAATRSPARTSQGSFSQSETPKTSEKRPSNSRNQGAVPPETGGVAQADAGRATLVTAIARAYADGDKETAAWLRSELAALDAAATKTG